MQILLFYYILSASASQNENYTYVELNELYEHPGLFHTYKPPNDEILRAMFILIMQRCDFEVKNHLLSSQKECTYKIRVSALIRDINLSMYETNIIDMLNVGDCDLVRPFIYDLNFHKHNQTQLLMCIAYFLRSIKLYFDLCHSVNISVKNIPRETLESKRQLSYRIFIKISFDFKLKNLLNKLKKMFKNDILFFVKDHFFHIDILRICIDFNKESDHKFPIEILELINEYFNILSFYSGDKGMVVLKPKVELCDARMPFYLFLEVEDFEILDMNRVDKTFLCIHYDFLLNYLKKTLEIFFGRSVDVYGEPKRNNESTIFSGDSFSLTSRYFEQGNSSMYMPIFFLKELSDETCEQLKKSKLENNGNDITSFYVRNSKDFFKDETSLSNNIFFQHSKNTFDALLPTECSYSQENTPRNLERDQYLMENALTLLINHQKNVSTLSARILAINSRLDSLNGDDLVLNCKGKIYSEIYDLNALYEVIIE